MQRRTPNDMPPVSSFKATARRRPAPVEVEESVPVSQVEANPLEEEPIRIQREDEVTRQAKSTSTSKKSTQHMLPLNMILGRLADLQKKIDDKSAEQYFPSDPIEKVRVLSGWGNEIRRTLEFTQLVQRSGIDKEQESMLCTLLTEVVYQLDFTQPYTIELIGHTGAGKST